MFVDTSFLIDVLRGEDEVGGWVERFGKGEKEPLVSAITVMELWEGAHLAHGVEEEIRIIEELLEGLTTVPFEPEDGKLAGELRAQLRLRGLTIDVEDVMIAASALTSKLPVLTRNSKHFKNVRGLEVETY